MRAVLFASSSNSDINANLAFVNKYDASVDPGVNDDITSGYEAGSTWINLVNGNIWMCTSNADGAATWVLVASGSTSSLVVVPQGAPSAKTVSSTMTAAQVLAGLITVTQGAGANSAQQMPTGQALQDALPSSFGIGDAFDFSIINLGGASETATLTVNTDVTIVGRAVVDVAATTASGSGRFRVRKTADHVFVVYRIG
jgi:hypothetical protein